MVSIGIIFPLYFSYSLQVSSILSQHAITYIKEYLNYYFNKNVFIFVLMITKDRFILLRILVSERIDHQEILKEEKCGLLL